MRTPSSCSTVSVTCLTLIMVTSALSVGSFLYIVGHNPACEVVHVRFSANCPCHGMIISPTCPPGLPGLSGREPPPPDHVLPATIVMRPAFTSIMTQGRTVVSTGKANVSNCCSRHTRSDPKDRRHRCRPPGHAHQQDLPGESAPQHPGRAVLAGRRAR